MPVYHPLFLACVVQNSSVFWRVKSRRNFLSEKVFVEMSNVEMYKLAKISTSLRHSTFCTTFPRFCRNVDNFNIFKTQRKWRNVEIRHFDVLFHVSTFLSKCPNVEIRHFDIFKTLSKCRNVEIRHFDVFHHVSTFLAKCRISTFRHF
jgi:hypothetical protein